MKCPNCGNEIAKEDKFCTRCGTKLEGNSFVSVGNITPTEYDDGNGQTKSLTQNPTQSQFQGQQHEKQSYEEPTEYSMIEDNTELKGNRGSDGKKTVFVVIGAVAAVLIVFAIVGRILFNTFITPQKTEVTTTEETKKEDKNDDVTAEDESEDESEDEIAVPYYVTELQKKYNDQIEEYSNNSNIYSTPVEDGFARFLYDELVEVKYKEAGNETTSFYYDNGHVYKALHKDADGRENQLFYKTGSLIFWIDDEGINHSAMEAKEKWQNTVEEASEMYAKYADMMEDARDDVDDYDMDVDYVLPYSSNVYVDESDLYGLSEWQVRIARNEIYARHGRRFKDQELQNYFDSCSWYRGTMSPSEFSAKEKSILNSCEKKNLITISKYETSMGYNR